MINLKYLILILLVFSCANANTKMPNNNSNIQTKNNMQNKYTLNSKTEKFDIANLEKNGDAIKMGDTFSYQYMTKSDSTVIIYEGNKIYGYSTHIFYNNDYFRILKRYYPNGMIKDKGWLYNNSATKRGIWHEYTENGTLSKTINYDELTAFTFEDIFRFCTLENIPLEKGYLAPSSSNQTTINRYFDEETSTWKWYIGYLKDINIMEDIRLDGQTGKVLSREEKEFHNS